VQTSVDVLLLSPHTNAGKDILCDVADRKYTMLKYRQRHILCAIGDNVEENTVATQSCLDGTHTTRCGLPELPRSAALIPTEYLPLLGSSPSDDWQWTFVSTSVFKVSGQHCELLSLLLS
jgi:hypothetical protein